MIIQSILQIDSFTGGFFFLFLQGSETFAHTTLFSFLSFFFFFFFLAGQLKIQIQINAHVLFFVQDPESISAKTTC